MKFFKTDFNSYVRLISINEVWVDYDDNDDAFYVAVSLANGIERTNIKKFCPDYSSLSEYKTDNQKALNKARNKCRYFAKQKAYEWLDEFSLLLEMSE